MSGEMVLENTEDRLLNVHSSEACAGRSCCLHNRSEHSMRGFPQRFRADAGFMERMCPHGIGHPDPDDLFAPPVHGCDGCCRGETDLTDFMDETKKQISPEY